MCVCVHVYTIVIDFIPLCEHTGFGYSINHEKIVSGHIKKLSDGIDDMMPISMSPDIDRRSRVS